MYMYKQNSNLFSVKIANIGTPEMIAVISQKFEQGGFRNTSMLPKDVEGTAKSTDHD